MFISRWTMLSKVYIFVLILGGISFFCVDGVFLKRRKMPKTRSPIDSLEVKWKKDHVIPASGNHTGTVFFLHGLGGTGETFYRTIVNLQGLGVLIPHPYLKLVFLTAPVREVTFMDKKHLPAWYDIDAMSPNATDKNWLLYEFILSDLNRFVYHEIDSFGWSWDRIIFGGFDIGGGMALNLGYSYGWRMAGVFALSTFLLDNATLYTEMDVRPRQYYPKLFWYHGEQDDQMKIEWARNTYNKLMKRGIKGEFHTDPDLGHKISRQELVLLMEWCSRVVPTHYTTPTWTWYWK